MPKLDPGHCNSADKTKFLRYRVYIQVHRNSGFSDPGNTNRLEIFGAFFLISPYEAMDIIPSKDLLFQQPIGNKSRLMCWSYV